MPTVKREVSTCAYQPHGLRITRTSSEGLPSNLDNYKLLQNAKEQSNALCQKITAKLGFKRSSEYSRLDSSSV